MKSVGRTPQPTQTAPVSKATQTAPTVQTSAPKGTTPPKTTPPAGDQFRTATPRNGSTANLDGGARQQPNLPRQTPSPDNYVQTNGLGKLPDKMKVNSYYNDHLNQSLTRISQSGAATPEEHAAIKQAIAGMNANKNDWNAAKPHLETLAQHSSTINQRITQQQNNLYDINTPYGHQGLTNYMNQHKPANATDSNVSQVMNQVQNNAGKPTSVAGQNGQMQYGGNQVLHASAGKMGASNGVSLFYTQPQPGQIQAAAVGQHTSNTGYHLYHQEPGFHTGNNLNLR